MRHRTALVTLVAASCLLATAACGEEDKATKEELVDQVSESLQNGNEDFDKKRADCVAEIVVDAVGVEEMRDIDIQADEPPEELQPEIAQATLDGQDECPPE